MAIVDRTRHPTLRQAHCAQPACPWTPAPPRPPPPWRPCGPPPRSAFASPTSCPWTSWQTCCWPLAPRPPWCAAAAATAGVLVAFAPAGAGCRLAASRLPHCWLRATPPCTMPAPLLAAAAERPPVAGPPRCRARSFPAPLQAHSIAEVEDFVAIASAVLINVGTLSDDVSRRAGRRRGPLGFGHAPWPARRAAAGCTCVPRAAVCRMRVARPRRLPRPACRACSGWAA